MKSKDILNQERLEIMQKMQSAIESEDPKQFAEMFGELADNIQSQVMHEAEEMMQKNDKSILSARGVRVLTSEENKYYEAVIEAMRTSNPKQALADLDVTMPTTTIDSVFEDLQNTHELLNVINFQNTSGLVEMIINTGSQQLATWAALSAEIIKELTGGFKKVKMAQHKLSAFLPVCKAMLDLGPIWLDRYVRLILQEASYLGLEEGIINGTGKDMPIGMNRKVGEGVTVTDGVYPLKDTVVITSLDPVTYGNVLGGMAKTPNGNIRIIKNVIMIVNPVDYLTKIMPATTVRSADGTYVNNVLPFPTTIIQSIQIPEGRAIIGLGDRYFMGIGTEKSGRIEYSDEYRFLEDERVYLVKMYGHGEPLDNNAFTYCDIEDLKPAIYEVFVANTENNAIPTMLKNIFDARLSALAVGSLTLSPRFNKSVFFYTAATTNATNSVTVDAIDDDATIEILVNGSEIQNGAAATWNAGINTVAITVTSGTETETYTVEVTKS